MIMKFDSSDNSMHYKLETQCIAFYSRSLHVPTNT